MEHNTIKMEPILWLGLRPTEHIQEAVGTALNGKANVNDVVWTQDPKTWLQNNQDIPDSLIAGGSSQIAQTPSSQDGIPGWVRNDAGQVGQRE